MSLSAACSRGGSVIDGQLPGDADGLRLGALKQPFAFRFAVVERKTIVTSQIVRSLWRAALREGRPVTRKPRG